MVGSRTGQAEVAGPQSQSIRASSLQQHCPVSLAHTTVQQGLLYPGQRTTVIGTVQPRSNFNQGPNSVSEVHKDKEGKKKNQPCK